MTEFQGFPKIPRLFRDCVITEKIDGTNAAIGILDLARHSAEGIMVHGEDSRIYVVYAQSRKRIITPWDDNFGFAQWAYDNAGVLLKTLGPGLHFGEWWGAGIQRGYGLKDDDRRFSLFNTGRWESISSERKRAGLLPFEGLPNMDVVPVLNAGTFNTDCVYDQITFLREDGSSAAPGFMQPEGIIVFHAASRQMYKVTLEGDQAPKSLSRDSLLLAA